MAEKLSAIKIPKGIKNGGHADSVRWTAFKEDGTEAGSWNYAPCYSSIMAHLGDYEIHCRPYWDRPAVNYNQKKDAKWLQADAKKRDEASCVLPPDLYKKFWRLCKKSGLIPQGVRISVRKEQNRLMVPNEGWDRHTVYAALSLYRHCDCQPKMIATAVLLHEKLKEQGVHFLQCLHYAMADLNHPNSGHVFFTADANLGYQSNHGGRNIAAGMALAHFAQLSTKNRKKLNPKNSTIMMFCKLAMRWNPIKAQSKTPTYYSAQPTTGSGTPQLQLIRMESILLPKFAPFYENPDEVTPKEFTEAVQEECKK